MIAKRYKEIREGIHTIVVGTLFDPVALKEHFSGRKKYIQEMLHLGRLSKPGCIILVTKNDHILFPRASLWKFT